MDDKLDKIAEDLFRQLTPEEQIEMIKIIRELLGEDN